MIPLNANLSTRHMTLSSAATEHVQANTPQAGGAQQGSRPDLPASVHVGGHTFHVGRVMTALSDYEAQLLHGALRPGTQKKQPSDAPDTSGLFTYSIGAKDCFASSALAQHFPEKMLVCCTLDRSLRLTRVRINDAKNEKKLCDAQFEPRVASAQREASSNDAVSLDLPELPPMVTGGLAARRQQRNAARERPISNVESRLQRLSAASTTPLERLSRWEHDPSARSFERRAEAAQRIRQASRLGLPLDLRQLQLRSLPVALHELLPSLKVLHLDDNHLTSLAGLSHMNALEALTVEGNKLTSLDSLPMLPRLEMLRAYANPCQANGDFDAERYPRLRSVHPRSLIVQEQRDRLSFDDHSDGWSVDSDARMQDQEDFVSPISEAASRWNTSMPAEVAEAHAASFYREVVPDQLHQRLQTDLQSRALLTLCAGAAFTADALSAERGPALKEQMRDDLHYLGTSDDAKLLEDCRNAADGAVNRCGDRVSYGWSKVHQEIDLHRMIANGCTPLQCFDKLDGQFQQKIVEDKAFFIASKRAARESVSIYLALAKAVQDKGVQLPEVAQESIFAHRYPPTEAEVEETLSLINNRRHNPAVHDTVTAHLGMQRLLREGFATEYSAMLRKRDLLQRAADGVLEFGERREADEVIRQVFGEDPAPGAVEQLERSGQLEMEWYRQKVEAVFADPSILRGAKA